MYAPGHGAGRLHDQPEHRQRHAGRHDVADPGDAQRPPFTAFSGSRFGFDFNPDPDHAGNPSLRVISNTRQNLRVNVNPLGLATTTDTDLPLGANIVGAAYTNNGSRHPRHSTTLYGIDSVSDQLVQFTQPQRSGTFTPVGPRARSRVDASSGFDIFFDGVTNTGFAALQDATNGVSRFYTVNLGPAGPPWSARSKAATSSTASPSSRSRRPPPCSASPPAPACLARRRRRRNRATIWLPIAERSLGTTTAAPNRAALSCVKGSRIHNPASPRGGWEKCITSPSRAGLVRGAARRFKG